MTMKTNPTHPRGQSPASRAGFSSQLCPATGPCSHTSTILLSRILGCFAEQGLPRRPLALASTSRHCRAACTSTGGWVERSDSPNRTPGCRGEGLFPAPPVGYPFDLNGWFFSMTLAQLFHLHRTTEHLPLRGVTYVAL